MIVGIIDFKNPKKEHRLRLFFLRNREAFYDYYFERHHIVLKCKLCGQLLCPTVQLTGPGNCGWRKEKTGWVCHQCCHGWAGFDEPKEKVVKERNKETLRKIHYYKLTHTWVKFRKV